MPAPGLQRRRSSISHKAAELDGSGRKVSTTFDSAKICALTCHGIAPARGVSGVSSKAKINQDRGVVCWPFNSSHNQALLCIFDGHGLQGEVVSQWCMTQLPIRLEAVRDVLATNPPRALSETVIDAASTSPRATWQPLACHLPASWQHTSPLRVRQRARVHHCASSWRFPQPEACLVRRWVISPLFYLTQAPACSIAPLADHQDGQGLDQPPSHRSLGAWSR